MRGGGLSGPRVAFFMATLGTGGIGKMRVNLTEEMVARGIAVDLLLGKDGGPYRRRIDPRVRVLEIGSSHAWLSVPRVAAYLRQARPIGVVAEKLRVNIALLRARSLAGTPTRVVASVHGVLSHKLEKEGLSESKRRSKLGLIERYYPRNDAFIAVSRGIADDLIATFGLPREKVRVVHNPVVTEAFWKLGDEAPVESWFGSDTSPVIISVGRLEPQKDLQTLIRAFGLLRRRQPCKLLILGEGSERNALAGLVSSLGLTDDVALPGYVPNPYPYVRRARLFVLSSRWEGFGNVLIEAMALGVPVVATDCPAGPRAILAGGRYGELVPVGDAAAMAAAMQRSLLHPRSAEILREAGSSYTASRAADGYLDALGYRGYRP